jgi:uncharacterized protein
MWNEIAYNKSDVRIFSAVFIILILVLVLPAASNATAAALTDQQPIPVLTVSADPITEYVYPDSGQVVNMTIDIAEGHGRVLINTNINTGGSWQNATKTAVHVAQSLTHKDLKSKDIIFTAISENASRISGGIDGPSAGGAMTVLLASELEGKRINNFTIMTGTINPDGTIGRVGGVLEKAIAAGKYGSKLMLVPAGQPYYPEGTCLTQGEMTKQGSPRICILELKSLSDLMQQRYGMKVIEVHNVREAISYFQASDFNQTLGVKPESTPQQGGAL